MDGQDRQDEGWEWTWMGRMRGGDGQDEWSKGGVIEVCLAEGWFNVGGEVGGG